MNVSAIGPNQKPMGETAGVPARNEQPPQKLFAFGAETAGSVANGSGSSFNAIA